jgi:hypothetical protein
MDITPGTPPVSGGTNFGDIDVIITKSRIARPISGQVKNSLV